MNTLSSSTGMVLGIGSLQADAYLEFGIENAYWDRKCLSLPLKGEEKSSCHTGLTKVWPTQREALE